MYWSGACEQGTLELLLDCFEQSPLSGTKFADLHGINYQPFATWVQKRKRERGEYGSPVGPPSQLLDSLVELELPAPAGTPPAERTVIYTLIENIRREGKDPYAYLKWVFERIPYMSNQDNLEALLPKTWLEQQGDFWGKEAHPARLSA